MLVSLGSFMAVIKQQIQSTLMLDFNHINSRKKFAFNPLKISEIYLHKGTLFLC
jgi:3-deoxy-D-arabino-heptulosonate 7-phosphate (DAHP) synthase